jgi:hypothetical protein
MTQFSEYPAIPIHRARLDAGRTAPEIRFERREHLARVKAQFGEAAAMVTKLIEVA